MRLVAVAAVGLALTACAAAASAAVVGRSVEGRAIHADRIGSPRAERVVLVVGEIHGTEPAGRAVVRRLRAARPTRCASAGFALADAGRQPRPTGAGEARGRT